MRWAAEALAGRRPAASGPDVLQPTPCDGSCEAWGGTNGSKGSEEMAVIDGAIRKISRLLALAVGEAGRNVIQHTFGTDSEPLEICAVGPFP